MRFGGLYDSLTKAEVWLAAGLGAVSLNFTEAECLRVEGTPAAADSCGGLGEDKGLSSLMDARGGKPRRMRYLST